MTNGMADMGYSLHRPITWNESCGEKKSQVFAPPITSLDVIGQKDNMSDWAIAVGQKGYRFFSASFFPCYK